MKKEWWIIFGLILVIVILVIIMMTQGFIKSNVLFFINPNLNNTNNSFELYNLTQNNSDKGICGPCDNTCIDHSESADCPMPQGNFICKRINGICTKIDVNNSEMNCEQISSEIGEELRNNQVCSTDSDCILGNLRVPCNLDNCGAGAVYNKYLNKYKIEILSNRYISKCQTGCPACAQSLNQIVKCVDKKCTFISLNNDFIPCLVDSDCSNGLKCWARCNGALHCASEEEIRVSPPCLPNE